MITKVKTITLDQDSVEIVTRLSQKGHLPPERHNELKDVHFSSELSNSCKLSSNLMHLNKASRDKARQDWQRAMNPQRNFISYTEHPILPYHIDFVF